MKFMAPLSGLELYQRVEFQFVGQAIGEVEAPNKIFAHVLQ